MQPMQPSAKPKKKPTAAGILLIAMIIAGVVLVIALIAWLVLSFKTSSDTGKTLAGAAAVIEPASASPQMETIESSLGVSIPFNTRELAGFGFADEVTYSSSDLTEKRPYTVVRLRPIETSQASRSEITMMSPELRITTSLDGDFWKQFDGKKEYTDLSKIDQLVQQTKLQRETDRWTTAGDVEVQTHGDTEYRKLVFTSKNEEHGVTSLRREDCYMTVQHDRPFVACINNIRSGNFAVLPQLEGVLEQITYQEPEADALVTDKSAKDANKAMLNDENDDEVDATDENTASDDAVEDTPTEDEPAGQTAHISPYLSESSDFYVFARAAPSVVRVGAIYCADVKLTLPSGGEGPLLTGACVDKAGTGFFVSRDGLIATSASTTKVKPEEAIRSYIINAPGSSQMYERLDRVLDYMVEARLIMQTDADAIVAGVQERNQDVVEKVNALSAKISPENISIAKEEYSYAVQLQDKPIVVNERGNGSLEFALSDSVIGAELEGDRYTTDKTQEQVYNGDVIADDIALLKVGNDGTYPGLSLASDMNIPQDTPVDVIGMPMYAVGTLASGQLRTTPLFRQGAAGEVYNGSNAQRILSIRTASHAGLAGAPALNQSAQVIGVATYNNLNCPGGNCFASTVLRDTSEIGNIARSRNVSLHAESPVTDTWDRALKELVKGNYTQAAEFFNDSARLYPQNYLATPFANYAKSQIGSATDTSGFNTGVLIAQIVALIAGLMLMLLIIARIMVKIFVRPKYETQYGVTAGGQYINANQWRPTPTPIPSYGPQPSTQTPTPQQTVTPSVPNQPYVQPAPQTPAPDQTQSPQQTPPQNPTNWQ